MRCERPPADDRTCDLVTRLGEIHDQWREGSIIGRSGFIHPGDGARCVMTEARGDGTAQRGRLGAAIERAQGMAHRAEPQSRAAAFIRDREAIAANAEARALMLHMRDAAGADDENCAIRAAMGAIIGDHAVRLIRDRPIREDQLFQPLTHAEPGNTGDAGAGCDVRQIGVGQAGHPDGLRTGVEQGLVDGVEPDTGIGRPTVATTQHLALRIDQAAAALAAASIKSQIETCHDLPMTSQDIPRTDLIEGNG